MVVLNKSGHTNPDLLKSGGSIPATGRGPAYSPREGLGGQLEEEVNESSRVGLDIPILVPETLEMRTRAVATRRLIYLTAAVALVGLGCLMTLILLDKPIEGLASYLTFALSSMFGFVGVVIGHYFGREGASSK